MAERPTVLVTGAAGFIGARMCEILHLGGNVEVRPMIRRWSSAARLGRLPLALVRCDLTDAAQVRSAMEGVDYVVHCAVGTADTNVVGTRNVLQAAEAAGVRKVVHLSTVSVYGSPVGTVPEEAPLPGGGVYGDSKLEAEEECLAANARGLPVTILRPTIVYGPFSQNWTVEYAQRLASVGYILPRSGAVGRCNLVYVDDVVGAACAAMKPGRGDGRAYNVNGPDDVTWWDYFSALNAAMGLPPLEENPSGGSRSRAALLMPVRRGARMALDHLGEPIMWVYKRSALARKFMKRAEGLIRTTPNTQEFQLYSLDVHFPAERIQDELGFRPQVAMAEGVALSTAWLRHQRFCR